MLFQNKSFPILSEIWVYLLKKEKISVTNQTDVVDLGKYKKQIVINSWSFDIINDKENKVKTLLVDVRLSFNLCNILGKSCVDKIGQ